MPIDSRHPDYIQRLPEWRILRDATAGDRTIKAASEKYLPRLYDQPTEQYNDYRNRALFIGATSRTLEAFQGMLTRKKPKIEAVGMDDILADCDLQGATFDSHIQSIKWELLNVARAGTLVDWSKEDNRPYLTTYTAEQIINWQTGRVAGRTVPVMIILEEWSGQYEAATGETPPDQYEAKQYQQWRELRLLQFGETWTCLATVWRKKAEAKDEFIQISQVELSRRGIRLNFLPFVFHGLETNRINPSKPIALDLAQVNISQYRNSADYENGLHMVGLPTPWAAGFTDDAKSTLVMGTSRVWVTDETSAKCGFLEFSGTGLSSLKDAILDKNQVMAALGARVLDAPQSSAEATETVKLRQTSESNVLTDLANCAEQSLSDVLRIMAWWSGFTKEPIDARDSIFVAINKDLLGSKLTPTQVASLLQAMQSGMMSFGTFFWNMQQGNMYPEGVDEETEKAAIEQNSPPPPLPAPTDPGAGDPPPTDPGGKKPPAKAPAKKPPAKA